MTSRSGLLRVGGCRVVDWVEAGSFGVGAAQTTTELLLAGVAARLAELAVSPSGELVVGLWEPWSDLCVVALGGEMDMSNAAVLGHALDGRRGRRDLIIDLSQLTFVDSTGIHELVKLSRTLDAEGGILVVAAPTVPVARVFEIVQLRDVLVVAESLEDALAHISSRPGLSASASRQGPPRNQRGLHERNNLEISEDVIARRAHKTSQSDERGTDEENPHRALAELRGEPNGTSSPTSGNEPKISGSPSNQGASSP